MKTIAKPGQTQSIASAVGNEAPICAECGGMCCKSMPGLYAPEDFGAPDIDTLLRKIGEAVLARRVQIDWWEGDPRQGVNELQRALYLRAPMGGRHGIYLAEPSWGGACGLLRSYGCSLQFDARPYVCRHLVPGRIAGQCDLEAGSLYKRELCIEWLRYADVLKHLMSLGPTLEDAARTIADRIHYKSAVGKETHSS